MSETQSAIDELQTIQDLIRWGAGRFTEAGLYFGHGTDNAFSEASWLVLHALAMPLDLAPEYRSCRLTRNERENAVALLMQRINTRKPAAYLTGEAWFCDMPFSVNEAVLIPRSPIAELIQSGFQPWLTVEPVLNVLDLCTGSGCIGIACAYAFPEADVLLADISPAALEVANANIARHEIGDQVSAVQSDVFDQIEQQTFDLIVANPPYVDFEDMASLPAEYHHEPRLGLEAGDDGLDIVRRILADAPRYLSDEGLLVVEVGNSQAALALAFPDLPFTWVDFEAGGHGVFVLTRAQLDLAA